MKAGIFSFFGVPITIFFVFHKFDYLLLNKGFVDFIHSYIVSLLF